MLLVVSAGQTFTLAMGADTVEFKFEDGTAIKIKGSADFVAAVTYGNSESG